jgi:threonine dehydrogenase-like Zn-dependent dehydrogenase
MAVTRNTTQVPAAVHPEDRDVALAWWTVAPGQGELRAEPLRAPGDDEALVRTLWTGVSRGTETLVARGEVPDSEGERMRAPFQEGDFPFPVKYGYLHVGVVERGPEALRGRTVFGLFPHQSRFVAPADALLPVPDDVPPRRAVLAGAVETALNVLWDARPLIGDRVVVVGAGTIGAAIARVARGIPALDVTLVDVDPAKRQVAEALDVGFASAVEDVERADVVIEASGSAAGLQVALQLAATDGEIVVASWYGSRPVEVGLGADFHSRRLTLRSSQVGVVAQARRDRRSTRDRLALALRLLEDPAFDTLLGPSPSWRELPAVTAALADGTAGALCQTIDWSAE